MNKIIVFSGLDGAGKSTQIKKLTEFFNNRMLNVEVFWSRGGYTPGMEFLKRILRKGNSNVITSNQGFSSERNDIFKKSIIRKTWLVLAILDLMFYYSIVIRFKSIFKIIICDRYLFDTLLDFNMNFANEKVTEWNLWKLLEFTTPKPAFHFVLTIPVEESLKRSKLKNEPFPDSSYVLSSRLNMYIAYCECNKSVIQIDCSRSIEQIEEEILKIIDK
jgi:thymidylate kinase